jgi:hypothetical protein
VAPPVSAFTPSSEYIFIDKNFLEARLPIEADAFLFFRQPTRGSINWDGFRFVMKPDARGEFHTFFPMNPPMPDSQFTAWTTQVEVTNPTRLVIELESAARQVWNLVPGTETTIKINVVKPIDRINIAFHAVEGTVVKMRAWVPNSTRIAAVQHVIIGKVYGRYSWATTGLFYKPYWLSLNYLTIRAGVRDRVDGGLLVL